MQLVIEFVMHTRDPFLKKNLTFSSPASIPSGNAYFIEEVSVLVHC